MSKGHEGRPSTLHHVGADDVVGPRCDLLVAVEASAARRPAARLNSPSPRHGGPFVALAGRFLVNDTSIMHVAAFGGADLPLKYRFAATWAAREGPLLMWLGWMSLVAWLWRKPLPGEQNGTAQDWRLRFMHLMSLTLLLIAFSLDPFKATPAFFFGAGLNPLLQTDLMVIHPPLIFLTYALCLHLTAIALSAAYTGGTEQLDPGCSILLAQGSLSPPSASALVGFGPTSFWTGAATGLGTLWKRVPSFLGWRW